MNILFSPQAKHLLFFYFLELIHAGNISVSKSDPQSAPPPGSECQTRLKNSKTQLLTHPALRDLNTKVDFFSLNQKAFKKIFLPLLAVVVLSSNLDQFLNIQLESALNNPEGAQQQVYLYGFFALISGTVFPVILLSLCLYSLNSLLNWRNSLEEFLSKYLNQIFIESFRSWGKIILWSLLFILPGIWKFIEYSLVPFIVTSMPEYDEGKVDALEASAKLVKKHWLKVTCILVLFHLFIPAIISVLFDSYRLIWKTPFGSLLLSALDTYLLLISVQLLFNILTSEVKKHEQSYI